MHIGEKLMLKSCVVDAVRVVIMNHINSIKGVDDDY